MTSRWQIYYNAVFGAIGGLLAWWLLGRLGTVSWNIWLASLTVGGGVGLLIGITTGMVTGTIVQPSISKAAAGAYHGAIAGLVAGAVGLLLGQALYSAMGSGVVARTLGWALLGLLLGLGEGVLSRKLKRASYGGVGGLLGGLAAGFVYDGITNAFLSTSEFAQIVVGGLGLMLIGACLGGIIPLSVEAIGRLAGRGRLKVLSGRREGLEISVIEKTTLGSSDGCDVYVPGDKDIERRHAEVYKTAKGFFIRDMGSKSGTFVGDAPVSPGPTGQVLSSGDRIRIGRTIVQFS